MLDSELQQRLKQHKTDQERDRRGFVMIAVVVLVVGILAGIAGTYSYQRFSAASYKKEINLMVVLAAESQNLDPAATAKAVENAVGKPIEQFSEADALEAFKYLVQNTKRVK